MFPSARVVKHITWGEFERGRPCTIKWIKIIRAGGASRRYVIDHNHRRNANMLTIRADTLDLTVYIDRYFPKGAYFRRPGSGTPPEALVGYD